MRPTDSRTAGEVDYLWGQSLRMVLFGSLACAYLWSLYLLFMNSRFVSAFVGPGVLIAGLILAFAVRSRNSSAAAAAAIAGIAGAIFYSMWMTGSDVTPYMLAVVLSLTALLFSPSLLIIVTTACILSIITSSTLHWNHPMSSAVVLSPIFLVCAVGMLSSLAVRNLYATLRWALERTETAQRKEDELRERRGQLARSLKALDEAYSRLAHVYYDLARDREVAEEARADKQRFAANVSHELCTPLNVILAFAETMYLSPESYGSVLLPPEYRRDVREIYRASQHLLRLASDVLDLSKIEARQMHFRREHVDLHEVVSDALEMIRPLVRSQVSLRAEMPEDMPLLLVDRDRIGQVLLNLLNNSRRFTEQGSIIVRAALSADHIQVTVTDTGVGIPLEEQARVFTEFQTLDASASSTQSGTGLGLALSKRFVEMHGGRIWVESDGVPGRGSQFHFTLPLEGAHVVKASPLRQTPKSLRHPNSRGRTLLLLGQDTQMADMLERGLDDCRVIPVSEESDILQLAQESRAKAVLVNSARREESGEHSRAWQSKLARSSLPIILCPLVTQRESAAALGAMDCLAKPVTRAALLGVLDRLDFQAQRILVVDDDPQMVNIVSRMLQATGRKVVVAGAANGRDGLQAMRSVRPDLVLLDLLMPELNGYEVLAEIQRDPDLRDVPVTVVSGHVVTAAEMNTVRGDTLSVSIGTGFTNEQVLTYLRALVGVVGISTGDRRETVPEPGGQALSRVNHPV